jgi:hypothetical protein
LLNAYWGYAGAPPQLGQHHVGRRKNMTDIYFSDYFSVSPDTIEEYGAFDVSLINDLPLFVDPFLLFNSENQTYQELHAEIIT